MKKILFALLFIPNLIFGQVIGKYINNRPSGGSLDSVQYVTLLNLHQTTAGQTLTIPNLSPATSGKIIYINDVGSVSVTLNPGGLIVPGTGIVARWDGTQWNISGNGNGGGGSGISGLTTNYLPIALSPTSLGDSKLFSILDTLNLSNYAFRMNGYKSLFTHSYEFNTAGNFTFYTNSFFRIQSGNLIDISASNNIQFATSSQIVLGATNGVKLPSTPANKLLFTDSSNVIKPITLGSGLTLTGSTLSASGSISGTPLYHSRFNSTGTGLEDANMYDKSNAIVLKENTYLSDTSRNTTIKLIDNSIITNTGKDSTIISGNRTETILGNSKTIVNGTMVDTVRGDLYNNVNWRYMSSNAWTYINAGFGVGITSSVGGVQLSANGSSLFETTSPGAVLKLKSEHLHFEGLINYATNAAAITGGLSVNDLYYTKNNKGGYNLKIVGSGGTAYDSLQVASTTELGGVKVDGTTITINGSGVISAATGGGGTVTSVGTGFGLTGGTITSAGTIVADTTAGKLATKYNVNLKLNKTDTASISNRIDANSFWRALPATAVRNSSRIIKIRDASNANLYDKLLGRTTIIKWVHSGNIREAMIVSATYASDSITITTIGDTIAVGSTMSSVKYSINKCKPIVLAVAGTMAVGTDISGHYYSPCSLKIFGADGYHGIAGATNATTYDIKINGTSIFTTKLSITSGSTSGLGFSANHLTTTVLSDLLSIDCATVSTTAPVDAYIYIYAAPLNDIYLK